MTKRCACLGLAILAGVLAAPRPAAAYVRYYTETGAPFFWSLGVVPITAYLRGFTQDGMTSDQVVGAVVAAAAAWSESQNDCTYLTIQPWTSNDPAPRAVNDGHNSLIFRSANWCQLAANGTCEIDYDPSALAFTWNTANKATGQIYDADIEINLIDPQWADVVADPSKAEDMDLQNAITHEMGHFIGLDHTCYNPLSPTTSRPVDDTGTPIPDCDVASSEVQETTMFPSAMPGDTQKRTLAPDDQAGLCGIYPVANRPMPDNLSGGCARCAVAGGREAPEATALAGLLAVLALRLRRRT